MATYTRFYPSHPDSIRAARRDMGAFLTKCGCEKHDRYEICAALAEAVANAVEHGHVPGSDVKVGCHCNGDVTVTVQDEGGGIRAKTWQQVLVKSSIGGFGLVIMRGLMDDVRLDIDDDFGATLVMHKRCAPASAVTAAQARAGSGRVEGSTLAHAR